MRTLFFISVVGFYYGILALGSFDAFGTKAVYTYLNKTDPPQPMPFIVPARPIHRESFKRRVALAFRQCVDGRAALAFRQ